MADMSPSDKLILESIFSMDGGYVLNFNDNSFQRFFKDVVNINIDEKKYYKYGTSKANRLRTFWEIESNETVGKVIEEMLKYYAAIKATDRYVSEPFNKLHYDQSLDVSFRLQGKQIRDKEEEYNEAKFLENEVDELPIKLLELDAILSDVLERRIIEIKQCLHSDSSLAVIFLSGSVLEGLLLSIALKYPDLFNKSMSAPKSKETGKPKHFQEWTLNNFIEVAYELGYLGLDVKKHGHALRDFRNYIHPYEQMGSGFKPDKHTAKISWQVLKAAMHDIYNKMMS